MSMRQVFSLASMQRQARRWKEERVLVGLVPTMGYLHAGHLSLVTKARQLVGAQGKVVVSIYVNPLQFGVNEDYTRYPRDLARDRHLCLEAGADLLFIPSDQTMYPPAKTAGEAYSTYVIEEHLSVPMEGAKRPSHFRGVTTIVAKLFNLVQPDYAVFGAKDYQQAMIIRRMTRDLNCPIKIIVAPTRREPDGLAMSSRNKYLSADERSQATVLWRAIQQARGLVKNHGVQPIPARQLKKQIAGLVETQPAARLDYVEFFDPVSLRPAEKVGRGCQLALAVYIGRTRLIDNARL
jgi:pantoate--beta-alanine ligase